MKKTAALIVLILSAVSTVFASSFTVSGVYTLIGADGKINRKADVVIDEKGSALTTGGETVGVTGEKLKLTIGSHSLVSLFDDGKKTIIYLVYGKLTLEASESTEIALYTPVSVIETTLDNTGSIYVISTEDEEFTYNTTSLSYNAYDALRGKTVTVDPEHGYDYMHGERQETVIEETVTVPNAPLFRETVRALISPVPKFSLQSAELVDIPESPVVISTDVTLTEIPAAPLFTTTDNTLSDVPSSPVVTNNGAMTVTQKILDTKGN